MTTDPNERRGGRFTVAFPMEEDKTYNVSVFCTDGRVNVWVNDELNPSDVVVTIQPDDEE